MNIQSVVKKINAFASYHLCRASIEFLRNGSFRIVLRRSSTGHRAWFTGSLFFLRQRWWIYASLRGAIADIFRSGGFSEISDPVLHDQNKQPLNQTGGGVL